MKTADLIAEESRGWERCIQNLNNSGHTREEVAGLGRAFIEGKTTESHDRTFKAVLIGSPVHSKVLNGSRGRVGKREKMGLKGMKSGSRAKEWKPKRKVGKAQGVLGRGPTHTFISKQFDPASVCSNRTELEVIDHARDCPGYSHKISYERSTKKGLDDQLTFEACSHVSATPPEGFKTGIIHSSEHNAESQEKTVRIRHKSGSAVLKADMEEAEKGGNKVLQVYTQWAKRCNAGKFWGVTDQQREDMEVDSSSDEETSQSEYEEDQQADWRNQVDGEQEDVEGLINLFIETMVGETEPQVCQFNLRDSLISFPNIDAGTSPSSPFPQPQPHSDQQAQRQNPPKQTLLPKSKEPILAKNDEKEANTGTMEEDRIKRIAVADLLHSMNLTLVQINQGYNQHSEILKRVVDRLK